MKVTSRDLYAILRKTVAPVARRDGFKRLKMGMLGWTRPEGAEHLSFWFQCDKYGWFDDFGSKFTLEFQLASDAAAGAGGWERRCRFAELLTADELETVRATNNNVLQSLPEPRADHPALQLRDDLRQAFISDYQVHLHPYRPTDDVWLHYFTTRDVEVWAAFFGARMTRMTADFVRRRSAT